MNFSRLILFSLCLLLTGCYGFLPPAPEPREMIFVNNPEFSAILWDYATELKYDKHLHLEHSYVCADENHVKVRLEFISQDILELCEARILLVDLVEGLLERINDDPVYAFFPAPYPLTPDQLEIYIEFESFHGKFVDPFYIGWMILEKGMTYFYAFNIKDQDNDTWNYRYETYEQSRTFANDQRQAEEKYHQTHAITPKSGDALRDVKYHAPDSDRTKPYRIRN